MAEAIPEFHSTPLMEHQSKNYKRCNISPGPLGHPHTQKRYFGCCKGSKRTPGVSLHILGWILGRSRELLFFRACPIVPRWIPCWAFFFSNFFLPGGATRVEPVVKAGAAVQSHAKVQGWTVHQWQSKQNILLTFQRMSRELL